MDYNNNYFGRVLNGFSMFLNALCGGSQNISMSARIGYKSVEYGEWFSMLEPLVNFTFRPIDGHWNHCWVAFQKDVQERENFSIGDTVLVSEILVSWFVTIGCFFLIPWTWGSFLIKKLIQWLKEIFKK